MRISRELFDEMVAHARQEAPNECCGMIAAKDGTAVSVLPVANEFASPLRYRMDSGEQFRVEYGQIYDRDLDLGAIYHSHTRSAPIPSQTDINEARHPDSVYIIVGLEHDQPDVRAYWIKGNEVSDAELIVE
jgi:[CysO sulfur-carrier protein]-S-L-cysteine hydrolase